MLKECLYIPTPESGRLMLRKLTAADTDDLKEWLGREEIYTYWGKGATPGEEIIVLHSGIAYFSDSGGE